MSKDKLVLRGVNPVTVCFTDRPARLAGHMPTSKFVPLWSQGKDSFLKDNPNATLSVFHGDTVSDLVVELSNPQLSGNDLSYDVKVLEGTLLAKGGACALFIDIIGMPRTPYSFAGAARRGFRHGYYRRLSDFEVRVEFSPGIPSRSEGPTPDILLNRHCVPKRSRIFTRFSAGGGILAACQAGRIRFSTAIYP